MNEACPRCGLTVPGKTLGACPRCLLEGLDEPEPAPPSPPGLELLEEIGRGGMGRVFRARHARLDRIVAVKLLPPELAEDEGFRARFEREARTLARLKHPNIVTVHDFGALADGSGYLVMEYVEGGTLRSRLPLTAGVAERVARELCEALACAHAAGIVHRDLKPENVLFDGAGRARLVDFGIAQLLAGDHTALTAPHVVLGTPRYMAPEARSGAPTDARADVFSLGILLREMLGEASSSPLAEVARRASRIEPEERYANAAELLRALPGPQAPLELSADEESWVRAVALTLAGATAISIYAVLVSVTPRVLEADAQLPFIVFDAQRLTDGRWATRARFEIWPTLSAAAVWAVALAAYGALRFHWRQARLEVASPERPLNLRALVWLAVVTNGLFAVHLALGQTTLRGVAVYLPIVGGVLELAMVYLVWVAVLEAQRVSRLLRREPWLWLLALSSLIPPGSTALRLLLAD
ncbi:MAG: serine/threonine protein kinase [Myxococcales bacterium]|nr:MAG: serine/threonine protein kinase [Myxococcales bacterium]